MLSGKVCFKLNLASDAVKISVVTVDVISYCPTWE